MDTSGLSLDDLSAAARLGDPEAESEMCDRLRVRFLAIAKRRVQEDDREDVVHDALRIVLARLEEKSGDRGLLVWSLTVLRNVIGNYYQKRKREGDRFAPVSDMDRIAGTMCGNSWSDEIEHMAAAIAKLGESDGRCARIFRAVLECLAEGGTEREVSRRAMGRARQIFPDLSKGTFYVALHRCRSRLRAVLDEMNSRSTRRGGP